jgi:hypothetical protein
MKESFYEELKGIFDKCPKYHTEILLGDFNIKVVRMDIFKPTIRNENLHEISDDNGVRIVNFYKPKISLSKVQCFHIAAFINILGHLQMAIPMIRLTVF